MKRIMIIVPSMRGGGSERVMSILSNNLDRKKFDITLILLKKEGQYLKDLHDDIKIIDLNVKKARYSIIKLYKIIKSDKPDIVFSTLGYLNILLSMLKYFFSKKIKFIARESSIPSQNHSDSLFGIVMKLLYKLFYNNFDLIIAQSDFMKEDLIKNYNIYNGKIKVINNPVDIEKIHKLYNIELNYYDNDKINLLAVGRLNKVKRFDILIDIVNNLDNKFFLTIIGSGSEKQTLIKKIQSLNLENKVKILEFQTNPYNYMKNADVLLLTSKYEGFPNVVLEANTCGTPVVAFNSPGGTAEIIETDINGILIENNNLNEFIDTLNTIELELFNKSLIKNLMYQKYSLKYIINKYEEVLLS